MKKAIVCILMLVFAFGGSFCLAKGLSDRMYNAKPLFAYTAPCYRYEMTADYTVDDLYADVKDVSGFASIYVEYTKEAQVTVDGKTKKSVVCFDSPYDVASCPYFLASGRELTAEDKIQADEMNVLVGGESWQNYKVGDKATVTVKTAAGEVNIKINVVGTLKTPFSTSGIVAGVDSYLTMTGTLILPYCPAELSGKENIALVSYTSTDMVLKLREIAADKGLKEESVYAMFDSIDSSNKRESAYTLSKTFTICGAVLLALSLVMAALTKKVKSGLFPCAVSGLFGIMGALVYKATAPAELPPMAVSLNATYAAAASVGVAVLGVLVALMLGRTEIGKKGTSNYKDLTIK